jgi:hypothetical protein
MENDLATSRRFPSFEPWVCETEDARSFNFPDGLQWLARTIFALTIVLPVTSFLAQPVHAQQKIAVRFLDFKSGRPMRNLNVTVTAFNDYGPRTSVADKTIVFRTSMKTDKDGEVSVRFPNALPNHMRIWSDLDESVPDLSPADVLKSGVVMPYHHENGVTKLQVSPKPGEIVVVNKRVTSWDRMRQEIP